MISRMIVSFLAVLISTSAVCGTCSSKKSPNEKLSTALSKDASKMKLRSEDDSQTPTLYVDAQMFESGNGLSWRSAFQTIQEAIDAIKYKRVVGSKKYIIAVAEGIYKKGGAGNIAMDGKMVFPFININTTDHSQEITILGGFKSGDALNAPRQDASLTVLDGEGKMGINIELSPKSKVVIDGFTIKNFTNELGPGGGIFARDGDLELRNIHFIANRAKEGGAVAIYNSILRVLGCSFTNNLATSDFSKNQEELATGCGGAVRVSYYILTGDKLARFEDCVFKDNYGNGRAIFGQGWGVNIPLRNCQFSEPKDKQLAMSGSTKLNVEQ